MNNTFLFLVIVASFVGLTERARAEDPPSSRLLLRYVLAAPPDSVVIAKSGLVQGNMFVTLKTTIRECYSRAPYAGYQRSMMEGEEVMGLGKVERERIDLWGAHDELHFTTPIMRMRDIDVNFYMHEPTAGETSAKVVRLHFYEGDYDFVIRATDKTITVSPLDKAGVPGCTAEALCPPSGCP